jgi:hypothetical protein
MYLGVAAGAPSIALKVHSKSCGNFLQRTQPLFDFITLKDLYSEFLPAGLARLTRMTLIIVATAPASTTKPFSTTSAAWRVGFRLGLIDLQRPPTHLSAIQRRDCLVGLRWIGHFHKSEASSAAGLTIRNNADPLDGAMRFESAAQFGFGGAVG